MADQDTPSPWARFTLSDGTPILIHMNGGPYIIPVRLKPGTVFISHAPHPVVRDIEQMTLDLRAVRYDIVKQEDEHAEADREHLERWEAAHRPSKDAA